MALTKVKINLGTEGNLSGSRSIIQTTKTLVSSSAQLSSEISGSFTTASSSFSTRVSTIEGSGTAQGVGTSDSPTFNNLTATGTVTAQEFHSEFVSASVTFTSGSHKFGNSGDDIQHMTGSLRLSGSITNESYIIGTNVGIGTNNPATKLHIQGSGNTDGIRLANTGYSYYNEIKNNGDGLLIDVDKGDAGGAGADLRINISDTERLRITNDGELGINSNNPDEELEVFGATDVGIKLRALGTTTTAGSHVPTISLQSNQGDGVTARASISADRDGASTKGALIFSSRVSDNITEVMRINGSGNVGIGTNDPESFVHILGADSTQSGTARVQLTITDDAAYNAAQYSGIAFSQKWHSDGRDTPTSAIIGSRDSTSSGQYGGYLTLHTRTQGDNVAERMRIDSSGNVGIGTDNPSYELDVYSSGTADVRISGGTQPRLILYDTGGTSGAKNWDIKVSDDVFQIRNISDDMGSVENVPFTANTNGNVGIGVSPSATNTSHDCLQIGGNASILSYGTQGASGEVDFNHNVLYNQAGNYVYISTDEATRYRQSSGKHLWYVAASGTAGNTISFTEAMQINNSGYVGIGTDSPEGPFHVHSPDGANYAGYTMTVKNADTTNNQGNTLYVYGGNGSSDAVLRVDTISNGTSLASLGTGHVGIGTAAPACELDIYSGTEARLRVRSGSIYSEWAQNASGGVMTLDKANGDAGIQLVSYGNSFIQGGRLSIGGNGAYQLLSVEGGDIYLSGGRKITWANGNAEIAESSYALNFNTYNGSSVDAALTLSGNNIATFTGDIVRGNTDYTNRVSSGYGNGNQSWSVTYPIQDNSSLLITAMFSHYGAGINSYGAVRMAWLSCRDNSQSIHNINEITSVNGGNWNISTSSSTVTVEHQAGSYVGGGHWWVKIEGSANL